MNNIFLIPGWYRKPAAIQLHSGPAAPSRKNIAPTVKTGARRVLPGFHAQRSSDVVIVNQPYSVMFALPEDDPNDPRSSATHESPYSYDTHVPLIIMGPGFGAGRYAQATTPADIVPTLAFIPGVQAPNNTTGRILTEGLSATRPR